LEEAALLELEVRQVAALTQFFQLLPQLVVVVEAAVE
jgi:hypothetical protein